MAEMVRQGDILLVRVDAIPEGAQALAPRGGRIVLAEGEQTGHAHTIEAEGATLYETADAADRWLRVQAGKVAVLTHQEHAAIEVPAGNWVVRRQREYAPEAPRRVSD